MPRQLVVLLLAAAGWAQEDALPRVLRALDEVREEAFTPGARSRVYPVVEKMVALADPRGVRPLAEFLVQTLDAEKTLFALVRKSQKRGATAHERMQVIDKELKHLTIRLQAGAHEVAPLIEERKTERQRLVRVFEEVRSDVDRVDRLIGFARELRQKLVGSCSAILGALQGEKAEAGLGGLRKVLDVKNPVHSLLLVRILRESARRESAPHLAEVIQHPTVSAAARKQAVSALASLRDPKGTGILLDLWERDPEGIGVHVRFVLSMAAKRPFARLEQAREWVKTLK